jgi:hypothetical protein
MISQKRLAQDLLAVQRGLALSGETAVMGSKKVSGWQQRRVSVEGHA